MMKIFKILHVTLLQLQVLKSAYRCSNHEYLTKFLKKNGNDLKEIYLYYTNDSVNSSMAKFCPNLKSLHTRFVNKEVNEVEILKAILNDCQQLESIKTWC